MVDDYNLLMKIINKNKSALEQLFQKYKYDVYRYAMMVTKDSCLSEDIVQDVFVKIYKNADKCTANINVRAWIIQITRNMALDALRRNSYTQNIGDGIYDIESKKNDFADIDFMEMLRGLNATEQEIVILHIAYGFKHYEIAEVLSKTPAAIRQQYKRTIQTLRKGMLKEGGYCHE
jgi:RNA polymerase sigma-70 factor (ECF subfamily)